ncbi:acyl carrier protein [Amycolatopsis pigmentata]|uniref:Acyl carrier protein n=1 Tax=Amycolatopsis pigmentata TaxID=450801 RepID=A0ABW5G151_9PSEU
MTDETTAVADEAVLDVILDVVGGMVREILGEYDIDDVEITMDTTFHEDLELESIDLVVLAGRLQEHYGEPVNLAEFLADKELEEVIALTVGELVRFVASRT